MAKKSVITLSVPLEQIGLSGSILMSDQSSKQVIFTDFEDGGTVILDGEGFKVKSGKITAGTVEDVTVINAQGKEVLELNGIHLDVKPIPQQVPASLIGAVIELPFMQSNIIIGSKKSDDISGAAGADIIKAGRGDDFVDGGIGKDALWGNGGSDVFTFAEGYGKDRIMDFDADGGDGSQDLLSATFADIISKTTVNGNAVLDFDNGDILTIIGVKAKDIDATDFVV